MSDPVNHPYHYTRGSIEVIDCIEALIKGRVSTEAYCLGNAIKYIARAGFKDQDKYSEDLEKAICYINKANEYRAKQIKAFKKGMKKAKKKAAKKAAKKGKA